ncbi:MAG: FHA domain-containing protein [Prevotellaceae bacterium]|jgi:pSer/pThr/pTyr-binding forkhead associated (FHA) protein|nr:FHA domain-containing protein [Prevotellaceae bacterium]
MMKRICLLLFCVLSGTVCAQQGTLKGNIDTENFPEVSFIWNEYNPDILNAGQFSVKENGKDVQFSVRHLDVDSIPHKNRTVLFLWEYQPKQKWFDSIAPVLSNFIINSADDTASVFNIAVFNQKQGPGLERFTPDRDRLKKFIFDWSDKDYGKKHDFQDDSGKPDLLSALKEGLDLTGKEPKENTRAIVVITSGQFIDGEKQPVINQSLKNKIPVYIICFPTSKSEGNALAQLAKDTYGQLVMPDVSSKPDCAEMERALLAIFNSLNRRHYGQDYRLTFTSLSERDGSPAQIVVNDNFPVNYNVPDFSLFVWAKAHLLLFLILLLVSLTAVTLGVIFGIRFFKDKRYDIKEQKQEEERRNAMRQAEQEALKRKLGETQEALKRQQKAAEQEKEQIREQEQTERLARLMRTKNLQPRLLAVGSSEMFSISDVTTTIGRNSDNDIVLSDGTVSKYHARIVFNGTGFEICDLQSANGIILNGQHVENAELKNGDIIQTGETVIKFYV